MPTPDAQYIVDIAAQMPEGDATLKQLDELTAELAGAGRGAEHFEQAIRVASDALSAAKAQTAQANAELAAGAAEFDRLERAAVRTGKAQEVAAQKHNKSADAAALAAAAFSEQRRRVDELATAASKASAAAEAAGGDHEQLARAAEEAASALAVARKEYDALSKQANKTSAAEERSRRKLEATRTAATEAASALATFTPALQGLEQASAKVTATQEKHAKTLAKVTDLAKHTDQSFGKNKEALDAYKAALDVTGGPIGRFAGRIVDMRSKFIDLSAKVGSSKASMTFLAAGAASVAAGFAAVAAAGAVVVATLGAVGIAAANSARSLTLTREALSQTSPEFAAATEAFDGVTKATGASEDTLIGLTKQLKTAKVSASQMPAALRAMAVAEAALGQGGASEFVEQLKSGKKGVAELSTEIDRKFGGIAAKRMLGLSEQGATLKRNLASVFGGLDLDPLLRGLDRLVGMFDETHVIGRAMKMTFEGVFGPLVEGADGAAVKLEAFVLNAAIFLTKGYISFKKFHNNLKATWEDIGEDIDGALDYIEGLVGPRMYAIGRDMLRGAMRGIASMVSPFGGTLVDAFIGAGKKVDAAIGRHSPAKEYDDRAQDIMAGGVRGIKKGEREYQSALEHAMAPPANLQHKSAVEHAASSALAQPANSNGGGIGQMIQNSDNRATGPTIDLRGAHLVFPGIEGTDNIEERIEAGFTRLLRGDAVRAAGATG